MMKNGNVFGVQMKKYILKLEKENHNCSCEISLTSGLSFADLHTIIQIVFGCRDCCLHEFHVGNMVLGVLGDDEDVEKLPYNFKFEEDVNLEFVLLNYNKFRYICDNRLELIITIQEILDVDKLENPKIILINNDKTSDDNVSLFKIVKNDKIYSDIEEINLILAETFDICI